VEESCDLRAKTTLASSSGKNNASLQRMKNFIVNVATKGEILATRA